VLSGLIEEAEDDMLKRKTALLLSEVLKLADHALPFGISAALQTLPNLVNGPIREDEESDHKLSSNMAYQIDSVNRTLNRSDGPNNPLDGLGGLQSEKSGASKSTGSGKSKLSADMDEIQFRGILVDTQVVSTVNYLKWKWDLISDIVEGPLTNPKRLEEAIKSTKFLKRLIGFYRPFKYRFSEARNTKPNQRYVRVGCALMKCLLKNPEGVQYLSENKLLRQLAECLAQLDRVRFDAKTFVTPAYPPLLTRY
jgi:hypothetical protein